MKISFLLNFSLMNSLLDSLSGFQGSNIEGQLWIRNRKFFIWRSDLIPIHSLSDATQLQNNTKSIRNIMESNNKCKNIWNRIQMALRDIQMPCNLKYKLMWKEIQKRCGEKYKWIWREIQMDVDLLISRRTVGDGSLPLPPTKQTWTKMIREEC